MPLLLPTASIFKDLSLEGSIALHVDFNSAPTGPSAFTCLGFTAQGEINWSERPFLLVWDPRRWLEHNVLIMESGAGWILCGSQAWRKGRSGSGSALQRGELLARSAKNGVIRSLSPPKNPHKGEDLDLPSQKDEILNEREPAYTRLRLNILQAPALYPRHTHPKYWGDV